MDPLRNYLFRILARSEYSLHELEKKLHQKFPQKKEEARKILKELKEKKWVSDERFCEAFIQTKILINKWGPRKLFSKLQEKGIPKELALEKIEELFPFDDQIRVLQILMHQKKEEILKKRKTQNEHEVRQKIVTYLIGKGFDFDTIKNSIPFFNSSTKFLHCRKNY
jgi:regulatory protein